MKVTKNKYPIPLDFFKSAKLRKEKRGINLYRTVYDALVFALTNKDQWW